MPANDVVLTAAHITGMWQPLDPQVSPDGRLVAYVVEAVSKPKGKKRPTAAIWVAPTGASRPASRWTRTGPREYMPRWSPDGSRLAFLSDRVEEGVDQIHLLPAGGGEAERLTNWKGGIMAFAWSPNGRSMALVAVDEEHADDEKRREESGDDVQVWGERLPFGRLHVLALESSVSAPLTSPDRHVTHFAWSPSGREVVAALAVRPDFEAPAEAGVDLVRLHVDGGECHRICHVPLGAGDLTWTADERAVLFSAWEALAIPSSQAAFVVESSGGVPRCLTTGMRGCLQRLLRPVNAISALCLVAEGLTTRLYDLDPVSGRRREVNLPGDRTAAGALDADAAGRVVATVCSSGAEPPEVWAGESGHMRRVSDCNRGLSGFHWAAQEPLAWTAPDGWSLDGLVLRPPNGDRPPPGVVLAHGGPYGRWADAFNCSPGNWAQWLALNGYAVFMPNPRGGMGHGHDFAATVAGEVGIADWLDVASGTDAFLAAGHADRERLGIGGWSQGGFMTAWAMSGGAPTKGARGWSEGYDSWTAGSADRFRAGVSGAGPTDWGTMAVESDMPTFEAMLGGSRLGDGTGPHRHAVVSPISYAGRVRTPVLFLHGRDDERVPVGQAIGFFRELRARGVPVEMALYPREPHGVREESHQRDILERVRAWYGRWLRM